jgi:hypothetical protein
MIPMVIVVLDELSKPVSQLIRTVIVFQLDDVLHCSVVPFNFALRLRMKRLASNVLHSLLVHVFSQLFSNVTRFVHRDRDRDRAVNASIVLRLLSWG